MDSLTQATLGAAVGEAVLGKKLGNRAILWGAIFGTIPDLDVIINPFLDTAGKLIHHRGASHSIFVIILASLLLAKPLSRFWKYEKITPQRAGTFLLLVWSTHVLIDVFTVYGTYVFWPFSDYRASFNNLFIIDPLFTLPMLVTLIWLAFLRSKKHAKKRTRLCYWGLGLSSAYAALSIALKLLLSSHFDADLARRDIDPIRRMEAPTPFNILLWRSVAELENEFLIGYKSVFEPPSKPVRWTSFPKHHEAIAGLEETREIKTLTWFSQNWFIARPHANGVWIGDMRFGESREWDNKPGMVDHRLAFAWSYQPESETDKLTQLGPTARNPSETLKRLLHRILGNTEQWGGIPRLSGAPGLPEHLREIE